VLNRLSTLLKKTFETQQDVDNQQAVVNSTAAAIEGDKAAIEAAQLNLDYTMITSPLTGKTSFRTIDPGNIVQADQSAGLFTIVQLQPIYVSFTQPQDEVATINKVFAAGPVAIDTLGADMKTVLASGRLEAVQNQVDQASGTISLKATFARTMRCGLVFPSTRVSASARWQARSWCRTKPSSTARMGSSPMSSAMTARSIGKPSRPVIRMAARRS
jgi:multidrug efflux system membrane fusion protein